MGNVCVSSCIFCVFRVCIFYVLVSVVYPVAILSAVYRVISNLFMFVSDANGDHILAPNNTAYTRWSVTVVWQTLFQLCRPLLPPAMVARLPFLGKPAMGTRWMAGNAPPISGPCRG